jgi:phage terminase large subunit-like protein
VSAILEYEDDALRIIEVAAYEEYQDYRKNFELYVPTEKQMAFHEAGLTAQERLFLAANRSGKTWCIAHEVCMHLTGRYPKWWKGYRYNHPIIAWVCGISSVSTKATLQVQYYIGDYKNPGLIHPSLIADTTMATGSNKGTVESVDIENVFGGYSTLHFKNTKQAVDTFAGTKVHVAHFDEEPPLEIYSEVLARTIKTSKDFHGMLLVSLCPTKGFTQMVLSFTENSPVDTTKNSKYYTVGSFDSNPHLPKEEQARLIASMPPHELEARTKGLPSIGSGMVYPIIESMITCAPFEIPKHWSRAFGMDFGWIHPTTAVFIAHDRDNDVVYVYAEYAVCQLTPQSHAGTLFHMGGTWIPGVYDPAGKISSQKDGENLVSLYRKAGLKLTKANNSVEKGIQTVLERMQAGKLKIFTTLTKTLTEIRMYARDDKGIPNKKNDDLMDAMRYAVMSGLGIAIPENFRDPRYHGKYGQPTQASYI